MKKIGDVVKVKDLFAGLKDPGASAAAPAQAATIFSAPHHLGYAREYGAVFNVLHVSSVGPRQNVSAKLLLGTTTYAGPTAYSSIGGLSSFTICASGATQTQVNYAQIIMTGTATKITTATNDGIQLGVAGTTKSINFSATADSSILVHCTDCSNGAATLSTAIRNIFPSLDSTYYALGTTTGPAVVSIWHKDGEVFDITSTGVYPGASADNLGIVVGKSMLYEFKAEDVQGAITATGTTLKYDHFVFRVNSTGTVVKIGGSLLCGEPRYHKIGISRNQAATVSSAHTT